MNHLERLQTLEREWREDPEPQLSKAARDYSDALFDAAPDLIRVALAALDQRK